MKYAYLDESGNLGKSGRYFVISAIVCEDKKSFYRLKRIMKKACLDFSENSMPLDEIHSTLLSFGQKQSLLVKLETRADHEIFTLIVDKKNATKFKLPDKNLIYNYLSGLLTKRIIDKYDDDITLNFDSRSTKIVSRNSLVDYLRIKANIEWGYKHQLLVLQSDSKNAYCIQVADLVSNVIYRSYRDHKDHLVNIMRPSIKIIEEFPRKDFNK